MSNGLFIVLYSYTKKVVRRNCCLANIASFESANLADVWKLSMYIPWDRPTIVSQKKVLRIQKVGISFCYLWRTIKRPRVYQVSYEAGVHYRARALIGELHTKISASEVLSHLFFCLTLIPYSPYLTSFFFFFLPFFSTSPDLLLLTPLTPFQSVRLLVCLPSLFSISALSQPSFFSSSLSVSKYLILTHNLHAWYLRSFGD